jgi:acetoin utilization protein AcuB
MIAKDLINYMIPPLKSEDNLEKARTWMDELRLTELPVADQGIFRGLVTEDAVLDAGYEARQISDVMLVAGEAKVSFDQHYYELLKTAYSLGVRMVAVNDENDNYIGVVSVEDVVEAFANSSSIQTPGAILILTMSQRDYSLSEISQIVENDNAIVLSSQVIPHAEDPGNIQVTLKINKEDISQLSAVLDARGYKVQKSYSNLEVTEGDQERFDSLMRYLKT